MHQAGILLVQGGFSLNFSRWECVLVQGSYLMFTLPKGHSQHLCANFRRHNLCLKHLMVWACSSAQHGVSPIDATKATGSCFLLLRGLRSKVFREGREELRGSPEGQNFYSLQALKESETSGPWASELSFQSLGDADRFCLSIKAHYDPLLYSCIRNYFFCL